MKKVMIVVGLLVGSALYQSSYAQVNVSVNIGSQPIWGPTGYDYVNYYYLPDLDIYYNVPNQQWVYFEGGRWITAAALPPRYSQYDLYRLHKVIINDNQPYLRNSVYRAKYASFKGHYDQQPIRDSRDSKYFVINNHPMHNQVTNRAGSGRPVGTVGGTPDRNAGSQPDRRGGASGRTGRMAERNDRNGPDRNGRP